MMEAPKQNRKDGLDKEVRLDEKSAIGEHGASRFGFDGRPDGRPPRFYKGARMKAPPQYGAGEKERGGTE